MDRFFASSYSAAREEFLRICSSLGARVFTYPANAKNVENLFTDVTTLGEVDAPYCVLIISGTHGPEALAGSACQRWVLQHYGISNLPNDVKLVFVHALNAYGSVAGLRCTEEGVDLNRNYVNFQVDRDRVEDENPDYDAVHQQIRNLVGTLDSKRFFAAAKEKLQSELSSDAISVLFQGQYRHEAGIGYGGSEPTQARLRLEVILNEHLADASKVFALDLHTGLGSYGEGLLLCLSEPSSDAANCARSWFGSDVIMLNHDSSGMPYRVIGDTGSGVTNALPDCDVVPISLEFGTYAQERLLQCVLDEYLIRNHVNQLSPNDREEILSGIKQFFYPDDPVWETTIGDKTLSVTEQAINGLLGKF